MIKKILYITTKWVSFILLTPALIFLLPGVLFMILSDTLEPETQY